MTLRPFFSTDWFSAELKIIEKQNSDGVAESQ